MLEKNDYHKLFGKAPIFGMIHLAGTNPVKRAIEEVLVYEENGLDGTIVENYHGSIRDVVLALEALVSIQKKIAIGVNVLPNEYLKSFNLADRYGAKFIQLDYVAGSYASGELDFQGYSRARMRYPNILVLGGVWPKYYHPLKGSNLIEDLTVGKGRAEAIVVTGERTGEETPIKKIREFRDILGSHPLVIGAGLNLVNVYEQLSIADGAIVGSFLKKDRNTCNELDLSKIKDFMSIVRRVREIKEKS
jgi:predicted TIM-barrel enzyme